MRIHLPCESKAVQLVMVLSVGKLVKVGQCAFRLFLVLEVFRLGGYKGQIHVEVGRILVADEYPRLITSHPVLVRIKPGGAGPYALYLLDADV